MDDRDHPCVILSRNGKHRVEFLQVIIDCCWFQKQQLADVCDGQRALKKDDGSYGAVHLVTATYG